MTRTKTDLEAAIRQARNELDALEAAERLRGNEALVGRCFSYRNCYSCPEGPDDYWTMYARVEGLDEYGCLVLLLFQTDKDGRFSVERATRSGPLEANFRPIAPAVFATQAALMLERVRGMLLPGAAK